MTHWRVVAVASWRQQQAGQGYECGQQARAVRQDGAFGVICLVWGCVIGNFGKEFGRLDGCYFGQAVC